MILRFACAIGVITATAGAVLAQTPTTTGTGATLRVLDKTSGALADLDLLNGEQKLLGRLNVALGECRFPSGNRQGEAYAWVTVREGDQEVFSGWMIGSSPALSAMDHPRYDVWVLRCSNS